jgi:uncharacterized protein (DUF1684 family)
MNELEEFRRQKDDYFKSGPGSPLTPEQQRAFTGLLYFPPDPALDLVLPGKPFEQQPSLQMQTTTGDVQSYERMARVHFEVEGEPAEVTVFSNENGLFLPFADSLAGEETYGAGRYLEPELLPDGRFHIDFNLAYNPYCAYNARWSCPITPGENRLKVPIRAGEKLFEAHT